MLIAATHLRGQFDGSGEIPSPSSLATSGTGLHVVTLLQDCDRVVRVRGGDNFVARAGQYVTQKLADEKLVFDGENNCHNLRSNPKTVAMISSPQSFDRSHKSDPTSGLSCNEKAAATVRPQKTSKDTFRSVGAPVRISRAARDSFALGTAHRRLNSRPGMAQ